MQQISTIAQTQFERHIRQSAYPGRGLVVGRSSAGNSWLMLYWLMGRSAHSRNRKLVQTGPILRTEPIDASQVKDASLIIYDAMLELPGIYLVSNGDQTRTLYNRLWEGGTFDEALAKREREPDAPNYTPRISAMLTLSKHPGALTLSILKANLANPDLTDRYTFRPAPPPPGSGYGLTTYQGDGNPLPSFAGDPLFLPMQGSLEEVLDTYWHALHAENRIALAIKQIPLDGGESNTIIRNQFEPLP